MAGTTPEQAPTAVDIDPTGTTTGTDEAANKDASESAHESARGRVRRLFLDPLSEAGFRFRHGSTPEQGKAALARMADGLAYLSDDALRALQVSMLTKGEGSARCFWPCYATVIGQAEAFERRPIEELPELVRWFRSQAGRDAAQEGRLAAEFWFWQQAKRPPVKPEDRARVAEWSAEWTSKANRIRDRLGRGLRPFPGDGEWLAHFEDTEARARALLSDDDTTTEDAA